MYKYNIEQQQQQQDKFYNIIYKISCVIKAIFGIM